ncbi:MAG: SIS domain-containing protein [Patescibacteria group bacterium]
MSVLDNKEEIINSQGGPNVIKSVDSLQDQLSQSFNEALNIKFQPSYKKAKNAVICGMGGSRFPSLIISKLFKEKFTIPYEIVDDYVLPGYVNNETLVIASSYSGTTEEVVMGAKDAVKKGAMLTGITTGGELIDIFEKNSSPYYLFVPKFNPSNQPRIGFGYMVGGHLGLLINLGYIKADENTVNSSINNLKLLTKNLMIDNPTEHNPAKKMASDILEKYPYFIVSEFLTGVGNAVANQTNETAKTISSFRIIPELNHHLMEGLKHPDMLKRLGVFIFFFSDLYSERIIKRFKITKEVVEKNSIQTLWHELQGQNKIEQVFELMAFGSYLSMYLAALRKEDPTVIPFVDYFKEQLKK